MTTKHLPILFFLLLLTTYVQSQISISTDDLPEEGTELTIRTQSNPEIDPGNADNINAQSWDWSNLVSESAKAVTFFSTAGMPAESNYPDADFTRVGTLGSLFGFDLGPGFDPPIVAYFQIGEDGNRYFEGGSVDLEFAGLGLDMQLLENDGDLYRFYSVGEIGDEYQSNGSYFLDIDAATLGLDIPVLSFFRLSLDLVSDVSVDAFGEMILPDTAYQVLRYNESNSTQVKLTPWGELLGAEFEIPVESLGLGDTIEALFIDTTIFTSAYRFYTNDLDYPVANASILDIDLGDIANVEFFSDPIVLTTDINVVSLDTIGNCGNYLFSSNATGLDLSYDWNFGDGESSTFANSNHQYSTEGDYQVTLIVSDAFGSSVIDTVEVSVSCPTELAFEALNDPMDCQRVFVFNTSEGLNLEYNWDMGNGTTFENAQSNFDYVYPENGNYIITLTVIDSNEISFTETQSVAVNCGPLPVAAFSIEVNPDSCQQVSLNNLSTGTGLSYNWDFGDGTNSTEELPIHNYEDGSFIIDLTINDEFGNSNSTTATVDIDCTDSAIETILGKGDYQLFPNPAETKLYLDFKKQLNNKVIIEVTDIKGRLVLQQQAILNAQISLNLDQIITGQYFIKVSDQNKVYLLDSFIKK